MPFNKRASLEISIQAIVIVVLAMTLLGFGLGFIKSVFVGITKTGETLTEQIKTQIQEDLRTGEKKISFPKTEIKLDKGESEVIGIGIYNKKDSLLHYKMRFTPVSFIPASGTEGGIFQIDNPSWFQFAQNQEYTLPAAEISLRSIKLSIPRSVPAGSYYLTFEVVDDDFQPPNNIYSQKDVFVVVKG